MLSITDPYELKPAEVYRQARSVASKTTRASDGNWYRVPSEMPYQWHLWFDGGREVCSATLSRSENEWRPGPALPLASLTTAEGVRAILGELLSTTYFSQRPKALGVILHVADEFALTEVAPPAEEMAEGAEGFTFLRYNLIDTPLAVLADREVSEEATSWRLLPFWGAALRESSNSVAVALPRSRENFLSELVAAGEQGDVPLRVAVTSAPLETLTAFSLLKPDLKRGCLIAIPYLKFTAVFALSKTGELLAARSLAHRGGSPIPTGLGQIIWNMAMSAELVGTQDAGASPPEVLILSGNDQVIEEMEMELQIFSSTKQKLTYGATKLAQHPQLENLPYHRPEFLIYDPAAAEQFHSSTSPLSQTNTFKALWEGWGSQNFFDTGKIDILYPTRGDLRLLRTSKWLICFLGLAMLSLGGWGVYSYLKAMNHPSWTLTPEELAATEAQNAQLIKERGQIETTHQLMQPRSQGWSVMEFLLQVFPEDSGTRLESYSYNLKPAASVAAKGAVPKTLGFTREWSFKGLAKANTMQLLSQLNSQRGLTAFFERIAKETGDQSYLPSPTRQVNLTITESRNPNFNANSLATEIALDPSLAYPFAFEATISQTLTEKDELAFPTASPFDT